MSDLALNEESQKNLQMKAKKACNQVKEIIYNCPSCSAWVTESDKNCQNCGYKLDS